MSEIAWLRFVKKSIPPFFCPLSAHSLYTKVPRLPQHFHSWPMLASLSVQFLHILGSRHTLSTETKANGCYNKNKQRQGGMKGFSYHMFTFEKYLLST
jgi:hypothetical protein